MHPPPPRSSTLWHAMARKVAQISLFVRACSQVAWGELRLAQVAKCRPRAETRAAYYPATPGPVLCPSPKPGRKSRNSCQKTAQQRKYPHALFMAREKNISREGKRSKRRLRLWTFWRLFPGLIRRWFLGINLWVGDERRDGLRVFNKP